ncbi:MAG: helix-turn-helix domain-containing protein [Myxococcota bacterium]
MGPLEKIRPRARGLVSSRVAGARVEVDLQPPPEDLSPFVERLWVGRWDLPAEAPHTTRLLADPCLHVVLSWGDAPKPPTRLVGIWTQLWVNRLEGRGVVRGLKLKAGAAGALLGDAARLTDRVAPVRDFFADAPSRSGLTDRPEDDAEALKRLTTWLRRHLSPRPDTAAGMEACVRVRAEGEILRVDQLAAALGRTERSVQRLFRSQVGASPKFVIRRHRLQEAALRLERGEASSLTELAHDLGYADQAHFARDWKAATSTSATTFARDVHR